MGMHIRRARGRLNEAKRNRQFAQDWRFVRDQIEAWLIAGGYGPARLTITRSIRVGGWRLDAKPDPLIHVQILGVPTCGDGTKINIYNYAVAINEGYRRATGDRTAHITEVSDPRMWRHMLPYLNVEVTPWRVAALRQKR